MERAVPWLPRVSPELRRRLEGHVQVFLHEKRFQAVGDVERITEEMRWTIASLACVLLLGQERPTYFPRLSVIRVASGVFSRDVAELAGGGAAVVHDLARIGESSMGFVALSWPHVVRGARSAVDGENVVYHELAHQLDAVDGRLDGAPVLPRSGYGPWAKALSQAYAKLTQEVHLGRVGPHLAYATTSPAEFFAVATEFFFERPQALQDAEPQVYEQLSRFYGLDPAAWGVLG